MVPRQRGSGCPLRARYYNSFSLKQFNTQRKKDHPVPCSLAQQHGNEKGQRDVSAPPFLLALPLRALGSLRPRALSPPPPTGPALMPPPRLCSDAPSQGYSDHPSVPPDPNSSLFVPSKRHHPAHVLLVMFYMPQEDVIKKAVIPEACPAHHKHSVNIC